MVRVERGSGAMGSASAGRVLAYGQQSRIQQRVTEDTGTTEALDPRLIESRAQGTNAYRGVLGGADSSDIATVLTR